MGTFPRTILSSPWNHFHCATKRVQHVPRNELASLLCSFDVAFFLLENTPSTLKCQTNSRVSFAVVYVTCRSHICRATSQEKTPRCLLKKYAVPVMELSEYLLVQINIWRHPGTGLHAENREDSQNDLSTQTHPTLTVRIVFQCQKQQWPAKDCSKQTSCPPSVYFLR